MAGAGFVYFWSGGPSAIDLAKVQELGLGYAFTSPPESRQVNANSPSQSPGLVFGDSQRLGRKTVGCFLDEQEWRELPAINGRPPLWIGYWKDAKPGPADLMRADAPPAIVNLRLFDGQLWPIPALAEFNDDHQAKILFPSPLDFDAAGNLVEGKPVGKCAALWDSIHDVCLGVCFGSDDEDAEIKSATEAELRHAVVAILSSAYIVSVPEIVCLGLLSNEHSLYEQIVLACCRGRWLLEAIDSLKKTSSQPAESGSTSSSGGAD
jgi:hypothetical protein